MEQMRIPCWLKVTGRSTMELPIMLVAMAVPVMKVDLPILF